jgi:hypothetical protein
VTPELAPADRTMTLKLASRDATIAG